MKLSGNSIRTAVVICSLLAVGSEAPAQSGTDAAASGLSAFRSGWRQRVLGGGGQKGGLPMQGNAWVPAQPVSTQISLGPVADAGGQPVTETEMAADGMQVVPGPAPPLPNEPGTCPTCGGGFDVGPGSVGCGDSCGSCDAGCGPWGYRTPPWIHHFSLSVGVQGFKGPVDQGVNGNFGFNEAIDWSAPLSRNSLVGYQVGVRAAHSDFEGDQVQRLRTGDREQVFLTAGLFRRAPCGGWQWGVGYDYLHDHYYYGGVDLGQIRTELSWSHCNLWDVGFWSAIGTTDDYGSDQPTLRLEPTDLFAFFYRQHIACGGEGRIWAGFTGEGDGLVGADLTVPLGRAWALQTNFNYLAPNSQSRLEGQMEESWGVAFSLVWYPGHDSRCELQSPYHPFFRVADNSVFMVDLH